MQSYSTKYGIICESFLIQRLLTSSSLSTVNYDFILKEERKYYYWNNICPNFHLINYHLKNLIYFLNDIVLH